MDLPFLLHYLTVFIAIFADRIKATAVEECSFNNLRCDSDKNLISAVNNITSLHECRDLCFQDDKCSHSTLYSDNGMPFPNFCFLYSSCTTMSTCEGCITEARSCHRTCSKQVEGIIDENFISYIQNIQTEEECLLKCRQ